MSECRYITPIANKGMYVLDTASWREFRPVMDKAKCIECGVCFSFCPVNAIVGTSDDKFQITYDYCKGCGICAVECPRQAILMEPEGGRADYD